MKVVLTGGGTGGHVTPFGRIIEALRQQYEQEKSKLPRRVDPEVLKIFFLGVRDSLTQEFFAKHQVKVIAIPSGKLRRYVSHVTILDLCIRLPIGIVWALIRMWILMPDVVVSKGGYGSVPTVVAAAFYRIPILLHESDSVPGLATRLLARFAQIIAVGFRETKLDPKYAKKMVVTGIPVNNLITQLTQDEAKAKFGMERNEKVLLVMGGSQGAKQINEILLKILYQLIDMTAIIHIAGPTQFKAVQSVASEILAASPRKHLYQIYPYLTDLMPYALVAADVVISRAGATTLAEIAILKKPSIIIPLSSAAGNHQYQNALIFEQYGAAVILLENNVNPSMVMHNVQTLLTDEKVRHGFIQRMSHLAHPTAGEHIANLALSLVKGLRLA